MAEQHIIMQIYSLNLPTFSHFEHCDLLISKRWSPAMMMQRETYKKF